MSLQLSKKEKPGDKEIVTPCFLVNWRAMWLHFKCGLNLHLCRVNGKKFF